MRSRPKGKSAGQEKQTRSESVFSCIWMRYSKGFQHYSKSSGLFPFEPALRDWRPGQSFTIDPQELKYWLIAGLVITVFKMSVFMVKDLRSITHSTRRLRYSVSIATASHASEAAVNCLCVNALNMVYWLNNSLSSEWWVLSNQYSRSIQVCPRGFSQ